MSADSATTKQGALATNYESSQGLNGHRNPPVLSQRAIDSIKAKLEVLSSTNDSGNERDDSTLNKPLNGSAKATPKAVSRPLSAIPETDQLKLYRTTPRSHIKSLADILPTKSLSAISPMTTSRSQTSQRIMLNERQSSEILSPKTRITKPLSAQTLDKLYRDLDKGITQQINQTRKALHNSLDKLDKRISLADSNLKNMYHQILNNCEIKLTSAQGLVKKELRSKILTSQWTSAFLADGDRQQLDPVTFAYARFALNISLAYHDMDPLHFIQSRVHDQLIAYTNFSSDMIVGPALMALVHLSLLPSMKSLIVEGGVLPKLLRILKNSNSGLVLAQGCKLLASLALHSPNKSAIVTSGCFHGAVDLILGTGKRDFGPVKDVSFNTYRPTRVPPHVQYFALVAVVNIVNGSDANRALALELKTVYPCVYVISNSNSNQAIKQAAQAIANIAYNNPVTGAAILSHDGDKEIVKAILSSDYINEPDVTIACLKAISNIASSAMNQSHLGADGELTSTIIRVVEHGKVTSLITNGAKALLALMYNHASNKARIAVQGGCAVLLRRISVHYAIHERQPENEDNVVCFEYLCSALASMLLNTWTQDRYNEINGLDEIIRISNSVKTPRLMCALAMLIAVMVPSPEVLHRSHVEERETPVEKTRALPVLKRLRVVGFGHLQRLPEWLELAVSILSKPDEALARLPHWEKREFLDNVAAYSECITDIMPDADSMNDPQLKGFLFSLY